MQRKDRLELWEVVNDESVCLELRGWGPTCSNKYIQSRGLPLTTFTCTKHDRIIGV
jgi:hypothetical protein